VNENLQVTKPPPITCYSVTAVSLPNFLLLGLKTGDPTRSLGRIAV